MKNRKDSIACIIVTYNPSISEFRESLESIIVNNVDIIIVDNGSGNQKDLERLVKLYKNVILIGLSDNGGIALAQNIGIKKALDSNIDFVWLSDQDTIYLSDYIDNMLNKIHKFNEEEYQTFGAIAPTFFDTTRQEIQPIVKFSPFTTKFIPNQGMNEVSHVIASGMIIPTKVFNIVGLKDENLFIDWVDMEWCWRAIYLYNLKIFVTGDVEITHTLGDSYVEVFGKKIIIRSPFRHYFMVRNAIAISLNFKELPFAVKFELINKAIIWTFLFPIIVDNNKLEHFRATVKGFIDGIQNKLGPKH